MLDIGRLTPDELLALKQRLDALTDVSGRTPLRPRQLHDLRLLPTATDARPTFFWSADAPRDNGEHARVTPYPKLMWHGDSGEEVTVIDAMDERAHADAGYLPSAPFQRVLDPMDVLAAQLDALSEADRSLLIEAQRQDRIQILREQLGALPEDKLAFLLTQANKAPKSKKAVA